jgi:hypothetical protein
LLQRTCVAASILYGAIFFAQAKKSRMTHPR